MAPRFDEAVRVYVPGRQHPKIVCLGGGHGLSAMLRGLKRYTKDITAIVRKSKGQDIEAACGQLRAAHEAAAEKN